MSFVSRAIVFGSLGCLSLAGACHKHGRAHHGGEYDPEAESNDHTLRGPKGETRVAARNIASARCEREQRCSNIGADKKFPSLDACEAQVRNDWADDLNAYECPNGVVEKELEECLAAIRDEDCGSPFDTLSRVAECTAGQICAN
jgi:hypothetical protein